MPTAPPPDVTPEDMDRWLWDDGFRQGKLEGRKEGIKMMLDQLETKFINSTLAPSTPTQQATLALARELADVLRRSQQ